MRSAGLLLLAAVACRGAEAQPALGAPTYVAIPDGWRSLPEVAAAGAAAAGVIAGGRAITHLETWGDPGLGCFVTIVEVASTRAVEVAEIADQLRAALTTTLAIDDWAATAGPNVEVSGTVARGRMRGRVRGRLIAAASGTVHATVAACFYNDREPARCQDACGRLLATLDAPKVTP